MSLSFLKKLGNALNQGVQIVAGFAPAISPIMSLTGTGTAFNTATSDLSVIASIIGTVEAAGQALNTKGPDKLKMAIPLVGQAVLQSSLLAGHKIADPVKYNAAIAQIASGVADLLNSLDADALKTQEKT